MINTRQQIAEMKQINKILADFMEIQQLKGVDDFQERQDSHGKQ